MDISFLLLQRGSIKTMERLSPTIYGEEMANIQDAFDKNWIAP
ncbi:MAG TPA: hypothetical protein PKC47_07660 [Petrimonas sp.]|nr:hypothetical protein [Petrimonas sp.]